MRADTLRTLIAVHTWVGIVAGFALFIAFYTGALTVFLPQLQAWQSPQIWQRSPDSPEDVQRLIDAVLAKHPQARNRFTVGLPSAHEPQAVVYWFDESAAEGARERAFRWSAEALDDAPAPSALADLIYRLHYTAGLPESWGIYVLGVVCVLYGLALATGVIVYAPGFLRNLFALRIGKNLKRLWQDAHNVIGVLSLPFHILFAWSGAVLALGALLLLPFEFAVFDGRLQALIAPDVALTVPERATGTAQATLSVPDLIARARAAIPALEPQSMTYSNVNDSQSQVEVYGAVHGRALSAFAGVALDGNSGEVLCTQFPGNFSPGTRLFRGLITLHYAEFGAFAVKWLYFVLGMAGAFLFYSGNLLWIETRRNRRGEEQTRSSRIMAQLTLGACLGCVIAVSSTFIANRLLPVGLPQRARIEEWVYYGVFLAAITWALSRAPIRAAHELLLFAAAITAAIPLANAWATGMHPIRSVLDGNFIAFGVDVLALLFGAAFWRIGSAARLRGMTGNRHSVWAHPAQ